MIKYIGSKRELIPDILAIITGLPEVKHVLDPFSGTCRVGHALKQKGFRVSASDYTAYASTLATAYIVADVEQYAAEAQTLIEELNTLPGKPDYFTDTFCIRSRFFQPHNGERIDAIRNAIEAKSLDPVLKAVLLTALMEAADRVDSTTGVQMAYLKEWAPRAYNALALRLPTLLPRAAWGPGHAAAADALEAVSCSDADLTYLDPPYNQHSYLGNYHIWETLCRWDRPEVYGVACKRSDCRTRKSPFNSKRQCSAALTELLKAVRSRYLLLSFSNEGYFSKEALIALLESIGTLHINERSHRRYVGSQIGIYNPQGEKVGKARHRRNTEYLFLIDRGA